MDFDVAGPFHLSRHGNKKIVTKHSLKELKSAVEEWESGLSNACGCYVFAVRAGKGFTPYYVGQACKRPITDEALNPSNREKYNEVLGYGRGSPVIFFLPMRTPKGKFRKKSQAGRIPAMTFLERWLIATVITKNPDMINNKETRFLRGIRVIGLLNSERGKSTSASSLLRRTLW